MVKLKVAIQKSGRLNEDTLELLKECGICINNGKDQLMDKPLISRWRCCIYGTRIYLITWRMELLTWRLSGENTVIEKRANVLNLLDLGFSGCRVSIAIPKSEEFTGLDWLQGKADCYFLSQHVE